MTTTKPMPLLWLLQLSDTTLPIGTLNHSFGLETLAAEESLKPEDLESFLNDYLQEVSALEIHFCGAAYRLRTVTTTHIDDPAKALRVQPTLQPDCHDIASTEGVNDYR